MTTKTRKPKARRDEYQEVTNLIVAALEEGVVPWHRPWAVRGNGFAPTSMSSGKSYRGINVFILGATAMLRGYTSKHWGTYRQIAERGGQVRKGEKATHIVFWKVIEKTNDVGEVTERFGFLRHFPVFNADQADGLSFPEDDVEPEFEFTPIEQCERISEGYLLRETELRLRLGFDHAAYAPLTDTVEMPKPEQFETADHFYGTLFHEFAHSTGCEKRLNRDGFHSGRFGDPDYSREELTADMAAAFVCGAAGIDVNVQHHAAYLEHWLAAIKADSKMLVAAAGAAQKAADLILGPEQDGAEDDEEES